MDTQITPQTITAAPSILEPARLTPEAVASVIERGQNALLGWLRENAPQAVFALAGGLDFLELYSRESAGNGGQVEKYENDFLAVALPDALNHTEAVEALNAQGCFSRSQ